MLKKIIRIKNVGLFADAIPNTPVELSDTTLCYAENGRGKSTLALILRACADGDADRIEAKKTVDSDGDPEVNLLFDGGNGFVPVRYNGGSWQSSPPRILIFDQDFIEQNVYSGLEVRPDQRQSLLEFALGDQAVQLKDQINDLTKVIDAARQRRTETENQLKGYLGPLNLQSFLDLQPNEKIDEEILELNGQIEAARHSEQLLKRQVPNPVPELGFDLDRVLRVLGKELADVEKEAETVVHAHLEHHGSPTALESWLNQGQSFLKPGTCPFCGQVVDGVELIRVYQSYFNEAYNALKREVSGLIKVINSELAESWTTRFQGTANANSERIENWKEQVSISGPTLNVERIGGSISAVRNTLLALVAQKQADPLEAIAVDEQRKSLLDQLETVNATVSTYNEEIERVVAVINNFKTKLSRQKLNELQDSLRMKETIQRRQSTEVEGIVTQYRAAEQEQSTLNQQKDAVRAQLDTLMQTTLANYQERVNELLRLFLAEFAIVELQPSYRGTGDPRTVYGLSIRGKTIGLGTRQDVTHTHAFGNVLSEADKRTLAFAFFIARLEEEPNLSDCIVVLDDPISSMDINRRSRSIEQILQLCPKCRQMVVLSHDAYFVRDLRDKIATLHTHQQKPPVYRIRRSQQKYSTFTDCDIDSICESDYYRHYRLVTSFVEGTYNEDERDIAKAIRLMLEGYYHRRYPVRLRSKMMLGDLIREVRAADASDPLSGLQSVVNKLEKVKNYANQFHHDTNPGMSEGVQIVEAELADYAQRSLCLVYGTS